jgi:DNA-binding transcriptional MerR regulator
MNPERHLSLVPETEYSIKEVLSLLREEFPEITISKIRFLESQGLLSLERTPSGYRRFFDRDIVRLREILRLQKSTYMPLKKIKEHLDQGAAPADLFAEDAIGAAAPPGDDATTTPTVPSTNPPASDALVAEVSALALARARPATLRAALDYGLLRGVARGRERFLTTDEVAILGVLQTLADHGLEPRHLRLVRSYAEREVGLIAQVVTPLLHGSQRQRSAASQRVEELAGLLGRLLEHLVRQGLEELTSPPHPHP